MRRLMRSRKGGDGTDSAWPAEITLSRTNAGDQYRPPSYIALVHQTEWGKHGTTTAGAKTLHHQSPGPDHGLDWLRGT